MSSPETSPRPRRRSPCTSPPPVHALRVVDIGASTPRSACRRERARAACSMSTALCRIAWNDASGRSNCTRTFAYSTARSCACSHVPTSSAASITAASSATRRQIAVWSPVGTDRRPRGVSSSSRRANLRVGSIERHRLAVRRFEQERAEAVFGARDDDRPVGGVAVEHDRLQTRHDPVGALAANARAHAVDRVAGAELLERDRAAQLAARELREQVVGAERFAASVASTADEKYGPGNGNRPISSITTTMSTSPSPRPPCASGTSSPGHPISAIARPHVVGEPAVVVGHRAHVGHAARRRGRPARRRGARPDRRENVKSMVV